jgi:WD40 repeat protein
MNTKNFKFTLTVCLSLLAGTAFNTRAQKAELVVQTGHSSEVVSVAFSPDGKTLASGSWDKTIKLWDVATGAELRALTGHSTYVISVAFSPDGKTLASASYDTIRLWNVASGAQLRMLTGHSAVYSVAFSPNGKTLASGSNDKTIRLWDMGSGAELRALTGHSSAVYSVAFSPDGKTLASGSWDNTIKLWDTSSGTELHTLTGHSSAVNSVAFSPDGKTLASGSWDKTIRLWDASSGIELQTLTGHSSAVYSVAFSPDGKTLASGSGDKTISLWDMASGAELRALTGHSSAVHSVAFSPNGKTLASGSNDKTIRLWDMASGAELRALTGHSSAVYSVAFSPDGKTLASGSWMDNTIRLWDVAGGAQLRALIGHSDTVSSVAFSPDGKTLASGSWDNTIRLWDVVSGAQLHALAGHSDTVSSVAFSPDGKTLASGSWDKSIRLWDVVSGTQLRALTGNSDWVNAVAFSPDGKTLASGSWAITLWDVASGEELRALTKHLLTVNSVAFSPDGKTLASGSYDNTIRLWDVASGAGLRALTGHSKWVTSVAFSADRKTLASGSDDNTIKLWDASSGTELHTLTGHSNWVKSVAFSPNGKTLASGSWDKTIRLWDFASGTELASLVALDDRDWVVVTPDHRFDTNKNLDNIEGLHWVMSDAPLTPLPLEIFMRDYYEPQLLPRLIRCNKENNCDKEFKPVRDISKLNRVQPPVKISNVSLPDADGYINVTVEVGKGEGKYLVDGKESTRTTGVYDVRLFRDGQMVGSWPSDGGEKLQQRTATDVESNQKLTGEQRLSRELRDWQEATEVRSDQGTSPTVREGSLDRGTSPTVREGSVSKPNYQVKIDPKTGLITLPPFRVKLPRGKDASDIDFSAYAFNEDRIKSQTAHWQWPEDLKVKLPKAQPVKPRAYIVAVGVNAYENSDFDLEFAADDARRMAEVLTEKLNATGQYEKVVPVTLVSDYETRGNQKIPTQKQATKDNFRAVLERLAGRNDGGKLLDGVKNADQLERATPDDLIVIMYSSHGYADRTGNFYFIPYDTGPGTGKVFTESVRQHSISSEELSLWLRDVDAGEMVMIVDACHSTAAVAGQDFKPGPMGSRGLGQLSYDKGMRILTATQSDNVALENGNLKQGLLTYALVREGIEAGQADYKPKDKTITIAEWLGYGVERVPALYQEVKAFEAKMSATTPTERSMAENRSQSFGVAGQQTKIVLSGNKQLDEVLPGDKGKTPANQQPSLFDFTRKKRDVVLVR